MAKAIWQDIVLAESDYIEEYEGSVYFPPESVKREYLTDSPTKAMSPVKGTARYLNVQINGCINKDAAWYYPEPLPKIAKLRNFIAFWKDIVIEK